jgi:ABC-type transport system involved in multi-copper enzyme maturation permease subunit
MIIRHLSLGPVFAYEWITSSRRWQTYAVRSCFVAALLCALLVVRISTIAPATSTLRGLARMAELFFLAVSGTQLAIVLLVAPAATAGAICLDRARGTLSHMMMTDLSDGEIVLGKLAARLIPVLGLLACLLPVLELLALLGGVDPAALVGGFAVSVGVAVLGCSLAMFFSLWVGKTHEALMGTYAVWSLWLLAGPMLDLVASRIGPMWGKPLRTAGPFFLALAPYWWPSSVTGSDYVLFLGVTVTLSVILAGTSVLRLRAVCLREKVAKRPRTGAASRVLGVWRSLYENVPWLSPSLDGNPVLWREWHRSRPSRWSLCVAAVFAGMSLLGSMFVIVWPGGPACAWVNAFQVSIGLLLLSVAAATSLAEERARGSLDLLLSTPLSARQIVLGKWLGAYRMVPLLAIMPALVVGSGAFHSDWMLCWVSLLMIGYVLVAGAAITSLGIAMAISFSRLGRAVGVTVTVYVLVAAGWLGLVMLVAGGAGDRDLAMGSPFYWAGEMAIDVTNRPNNAPIGWAILWTITWAVASGELLRFSIGDFERRLGRTQQPHALLALPRRRVQVLTKCYVCLAVALGLIALNPEWAPSAIAFQLTLGFLLAAGKAAVSSIARQDEGGGGELSISGSSVLPEILGWLAASYRSIVPVTVPSLIILASHVPHRTFSFDAVVIAVYAFSVGAAFLRLGVTMTTWRLGRGWTTTSLIVVWAIINAGLLALAGALGGESSPFGLAVGMGSPFLGVSLLGTAMIHPSSGLQMVVTWALLWSVLYALAAAWLFKRDWMKGKADDFDLIRRNVIPQLTVNNSR